jgi:hypothetical protein
MEHGVVMGAAVDGVLGSVLGALVEAALRRAVLLLAALLALGTAACGPVDAQWALGGDGGTRLPDGGWAPADGGTTAGAGGGGGADGGVPVSAVSLQPRASQVTFDPGNGKTTVVVQFTARRQDGWPLSDTEVQTQLKVNDKPVDVESLLQRDASALAVNVRFGMVLDASYSMLRHTPQAFGPMKTAARDSVKSLQEFWRARGQRGTASWSFLWFEEQLNEPAADWVPDNILQLPDPQPGSSTKLYSATHAMVGRMHDAYRSGVASGERDMHVLVVFSDGADNYSWFDNSSAVPRTLTIPGTALTYQRSGTAATTLQQVKDAVAAHPKLTVHTIGLGSDVNDAELQALATAGRGVYVKNSSATAIGELFNRVLQEAVTVQTVGATMPLPPGDYTLTLRVSAGAGVAEHQVRFHAGDATARLLP